MAYDPELGYDPDVDYSTLLGDPNLSAADRERYTRERQAKINNMYGGVEPEYQGSGKTFSQTYGANGAGAIPRDTSWYAPSVYSVGDPDYRTVDAANGFARDPLTGRTTQSGYDLTGLPANDWGNDKSNYAAAALQSQSEAEIKTWLDARTRKAAAQGIDISGADPRYQSNDAIYQQWWNERGRYIPSSFTSSDGSGGVGYYGQDEAGRWGYYADPQRTIKLANGYWDKKAGGVRRAAQLDTPGGTLTSGGGEYAGSLRPASGEGYGSGGAGGADALAAQLQALYTGQNNAYAQALAAQRSAQDAAVRQAVERLSTQKQGVNSSYAALFRQLYLDRMNAQRDIDQRLAAQGVTGGAAESTRLGIASGYEEALRQGEQSRIGELGDIDRAIADAQLDGELANAQASAQAAREWAQDYAKVLKTLLERYDDIAARREKYAREDAQLAQKYAQENTQLAQKYAYQREQDAAAARARQEAFARESAQTEREYAYKTAMQLIGAGYLPDDELLAAAGIGAEAARAMADAVLAQQSAAAEKAAAEAAKPKLTAAQVNAALKAGRVTPEVRSAYEYWYGAPYRG